MCYTSKLYDTASVVFDKLTVRMMRCFMNKIHVYYRLGQAKSCCAENKYEWHEKKYYLDSIILNKGP